MLLFFILGCCSYLAHAAAIYEHEQQPLNGDDRKDTLTHHAQKPVDEIPDTRGMALAFDNVDKYILPTVERETGPPTLGSLQNISTYQASDFPYSIMAFVAPNPSSRDFPSSLLVALAALSSNTFWASFQPGYTWLDFDRPQAEHIPLSSVGVRNGGMVTKPARSVRLDLDTPYITVPNEMHDVVLLATTPWWNRNMQSDKLMVDCESLDTFPDLVFRLENEVDEIVVTPRQYFVREGKECVLMVRADRNDEIVLGWAAIRGREFVLDWVAGKMGFSSPWPWSPAYDWNAKVDIE